MAKTNRVGARRARVPKRARRASCGRKRGPKPGTPSWRKFTFTDELTAECRRRIEQTPESTNSIAIGLGMSESTLRRMARRNNWHKFRPPPRDLPPGMRLAAQAAALKQALVSAHAGGEETAIAPVANGEGLDAPPPLSVAQATADIDRMHRVVMGELATVETMRARMKSAPQRPADATKTAGTLARLTATMRDLQHMRAVLEAGANATTLTQGSFHDEDMPADIDAFRDELARRIRAFFAARRGGGDAAGNAAAPVAEGGA